MYRFADTFLISLVLNILYLALCDNNSSLSYHEHIQVKYFSSKIPINKTFYHRYQISFFHLMIISTLQESCGGSFRTRTNVAIQRMASFATRWITRRYPHQKYELVFLPIYSASLIVQCLKSFQTIALKVRE